MKRIFSQTKLYDYSSKSEALKHKKYMLKHGWHIEKDLYNNESEVYPYSILYFK